MNISKWLLYKNYSMLYIHDKAKRHRVTNNFFLIYEITNSYFATSYIADIPPIFEIRLHNIVIINTKHENANLY